jgi:hypothetical protein
MPRLSDQERQEVMRYLEADQPLPEKYRFLLFEDKRQVELVWNGKTNTVCNVVLPFQTIEQVDEPRAEKETRLQLDLLDVDNRGRQLKGWTNKLIWGDNKLILSSLKNGPLREEIEKQGGIKLIYIDPPFDVGADFSMDIEIGGDTFTKKPNILEELAYRDTWGKGKDSFIAMIYERLVLMRDMLADDGSIFVHMGPRLDAQVKMVLDEIFGSDRQLGHVIWQRHDPHNDAVKKLGVITDRIMWYSKSGKYYYDSDIERTSLSAGGEREYEQAGQHNIHADQQAEPEVSVSMHPRISSWCRPPSAPPASARSASTASVRSSRRPLRRRSGPADGRGGSRGRRVITPLDFTHRGSGGRRRRRRRRGSTT